MGPFIYNPFAKKNGAGGDSAAAPPMRWVVGEKVGVDIEIWNPTSVEWQARPSWQAWGPWVSFCSEDPTHALTHLHASMQGCTPARSPARRHRLMHEHREHPCTRTCFAGRPMQSSLKRRPVAVLQDTASAMCR